MPSVALVTGSSRGIGLSVARAVAALSPPDSGLVLVCRDKGRGDAAAAELAEEAGGANVWCEQCDVSRWEDVDQLRQRLEAGGLKVWLLVNNAAECPLEQQLVRRNKKDGQVVTVDKQFATNVLGYHFMMAAFLRPNMADDGILCINVASNWAGDLDLDDLDFRARGYDPDSAYRQSKAADRMLSQEWARRTAELPYTLVSCHPGDPCTQLSRSLGYNLGASRDCRPVVESNIVPLVQQHLSSNSGSNIGSLVQQHLSSNIGSNTVPLVQHRGSLSSGGWYCEARLARCQFSGGNLKVVREKLFQICDDFVLDQ